MTKDEIIESAKNDRDNGMTYKAIAEKYNVSVSAVKSWASRKWNKVATKSKKVATKKQNVTKEQVEQFVDDISESGLTAKQQMFVTEYLRTYNATQAYINAYGAKYNVANVEGPKNLVKPSIQAAIQEVRKNQLSTIGVDAISLIQDVAREAKADVGDVVEFDNDDVYLRDENGAKVKDINGNEVIKHRSQVWLKPKSHVDTSVIKKVTIGKDGVVVELHDKAKARDKLFEWLSENTTTEKREDGLLDALNNANAVTGGDDDEIET